MTKGRRLNRQSQAAGVTHQREMVAKSWSQSEASNIWWMFMLLTSTATCSSAFVCNSIQSDPRKHSNVHREAALFAKASPTSSDEWPSIFMEDRNKSPESSFWNVIPDTSSASSSSSSLPAIHQLDHETGILPPGAYRTINNDDGRDTLTQSLISVGIVPPSNRNDGKNIWKEGVKNCQNLIDSGFNTFRVNDGYGGHQLESSTHGGKRGSKSPSSIAMEQKRKTTSRTERRHESEAQFYQTLRHNTPFSVLQSCHFMVNMEIPSVLSEVDPLFKKNSRESSAVQFGNGWMVRESVSNALLRVKGECLDTVVLECKLLC
eukprot:scaffold13967_cov200-Alexandrium_tamarense.AAC.3